MKFVMATQELNFLISKCLNVISQKPNVPILANFRLEVAGGQLSIMATDLSVGICSQTDVKVLEEGATTLPGKKLASLIRELTAANVEIVTNKNEITEIKANTSSFKLNGMDQKEYPTLPDMKGAEVIIMSQAELKEMLSRTAFCVSKEDTRFALTGVCCRLQEGQATFFGTDGKRLARCQMKVQANLAFSGSFIIPIKAVDEVIKNLSDAGDVRISFLNDKIAFETAETRIITKLLAGDYPDVSRVIPEQSNTVVALHREEMISLLRQVTLFTSEERHVVRCSFTKGELKLSAHASEIGEGKVSMPVNYLGEAFDIAFNPSYFIEMLRHMKGEVVFMGIIDPYNPAIFTEAEEKSTGDQRVLYILMPLRLE